MSRPALEVANIFRDFGAAWRTANAGYVSLGQLKVMSAIENCRTAALGGHVMRCEDCAYTTIAYNSCRNRHGQSETLLVNSRVGGQRPHHTHRGRVDDGLARSVLSQRKTNQNFGEDDSFAFARHC